MVKPNIKITKNKSEKEKCSLCDTPIDKGESCLIIFSNSLGGFINSPNNKFHLSCIKPLFKEIKLVMREKMIENLQSNDENNKK